MNKHNKPSDLEMKLAQLDKEKEKIEKEIFMVSFPSRALMRDLLITKNNGKDPFMCDDNIVKNGFIVKFHMTHTPEYQNEYDIDSGVTEVLMQVLNPDNTHNSYWKYKKSYNSWDTETYHDFSSVCKVEQVTRTVIDWVPVED